MDGRYSYRNKSCCGRMKTVKVDKLRAEALDEFLANWQAEHGVLTAEEIAQEVEKSQWIAIAMDQLLGPDTGRVFNDVCAEVAAGNTTPEQAAKTIEDSWNENKM